MVSPAPARRAPILVVDADEATRALYRASLELSQFDVIEASEPPSVAPPTLSCPLCDHRLIYERSHIGGVTRRHAEQWDDFTCAQCGVFQYRQRTRSLHHVVQ